MLCSENKCGYLMKDVWLENYFNSSIALPNNSH